MMNLIERLDDLLEITRYEKETGKKPPTYLERLKPYVNKPWVFFHLSDYNKLGIYPASSFNTPLGIYAYPLTTELHEQLYMGTLPFARERRFLHAFEVRQSSRSSPTL